MRHVKRIGRLFGSTPPTAEIYASRADVAGRPTADTALVSAIQGAGH